MGKQPSKIDLENFFSLLGGTAVHDHTEAQKLNSLFFTAFEQKWKNSDANLRQKMIRFAGALEVENGLQPVLLGLNDFVRSIREEAKASLEKLSQQTKISIHNEQNLSPQAIRRSAEFSMAVYQKIKATKDLDLIKFFLHTLMKIGGKGPILAWHFFTQGLVPENIVIEIIRPLPEILRLVFVYHYSLDSFSVRRHYGDLAKSLLKDIQDPHTVVSFLANLFDQDAFPDPVFDDLCQRLEIQGWAAQKILKTSNQKEKAEAVKAMLMASKGAIHYSVLGLLSPSEPSSMRLEMLRIFSRRAVRINPKIIETVSALLNDQDPNVALHAFQALVALNAPDLGKTTVELLRKSPSLRSNIFQCFPDMHWIELMAILVALAPDQAEAARSTVVHKLVQEHPERLVVFLNQYVKSSEAAARTEAVKLLGKIDPPSKIEFEETRRNSARKPLSSSKASKGFFKKIVGIKQNKELKRLINREPIEDAEFQGEALSGIDLSGIHLNNVNFDGAVFSHVNLSSATLTAVTFRGAHLDHVNMDRAVLDSASFENTILTSVSATKAVFNSCNFTGACIRESSFDSAGLPSSFLLDADIRNTRFLQSDLSESSWVGSTLSNVSFKFANLLRSDFSLVQGRFCDFSGAVFSTAATQMADLNTRCTTLDDQAITSFSFETDLLKADGFNFLVLSEGMERMREAFFKYNLKRIELALDTFRPDQQHLFELIPFLLHSNSELVPTDTPVRDAPAGIFGYFPSSNVLKLLKKYFIFEESSILQDAPYTIEGLFTIGSIGTIAQSADSDIDYWVCADESKLGKEGLARLNAKLSAIEQWALKTFNTELHFFIVAPASVQEDRFGASDQESSGSAQGKILKEEFYRTMIHVAGKIPLWCVIPPQIKSKNYQYLLKFASRFYPDYLDLGNVSSIPKGEYFGASIWQLFKSLKSPYKSVMKMSLLEKYIREEHQSDLLCNRLKSFWATGNTDPKQTDPYLLLFEEVLDYYQKNKQKKVESLLQICFFLKLGIRSITDLDKSVTGIRKKLVQEYIENWGWDEAKVQDFGQYREWPFDKIFHLSTTINQYMIGTYKKLNRSLQEAADGKTMITSQDLTILGRKMFVQFAKQPHKVEKLPLIAHGNILFKQLYLRYDPSAEASVSWKLFQAKKEGRGTRSREEILKEAERLEEIAVWLVHNGLYLPTAAFQLLPNPTPISIQEILELLQKLHDFFPLKEVETLSAQALLKKPDVRKLFVVMNLNTPRKLTKIHEYTAIYMTSWGEFFCKVLSDTAGILSAEDTVYKVKEQLDLTVSSDPVEYYIPQSARKRIG